MESVQDKEKLDLVLNDKYPPEDQLSELGFDLVQSTQGYFDSEKGYTIEEIIIQRKNDGRYFRGEYENWGRGVYEYYNHWEEVFARQITTTVYE